ncbi:helix-turn-helix domain-containing protein [Paenibacillus terrae]|uniref:HTH cro/C1-type domain-containing protein n=1 Tax=Paenibacillus terrae TaxID=159743 RepID=A0A0D7WUZ3_9BACL|nr:helix-turn-helix transcriptional regulator [Paenibacillus terrae]KJD42794.1 hypothetical protein QD47_26235 [Paenibacillus terrae]
MELATIREELEVYLKRESITLCDFAKLTGLNQGTISYLIRGRRPISVHYLDQITMGMGLDEGYYYDLYIDNYIEESLHWRRIRPLLHRCAELDKLDCIQRLVQFLKDKLLYMPLLFDTAEEWFECEHRAAAKLLYECVAEGELFQYSERLAICQYRLFTIGIGDNQNINLQTAIRFEPFVNRLDEVEQLDAFKNLANVFGSLHCWVKVDELADQLKEKAMTRYKFRSKKQPERPIIFYILYAYLLKARVHEERGEFVKALDYVSHYADTDWFKSTAYEEQQVIDQFKELAIANTFLYRLMTGEVDVLPDYVNYMELRESEIFPVLFKIVEAANRYQINIDDILLRFNGHLAYTEKGGTLGKLSQQVSADRYTCFLAELAIYYLQAERVHYGLNYLLESLEWSIKISSVPNIIRCAAWYEDYRDESLPEQKKLYEKTMVELLLKYEKKGQKAEAVMQALHF